MNEDLDHGSVLPFLRLTLTKINSFGNSIFQGSQREGLGGLCDEHQPQRHWQWTHRRKRVPWAARRGCLENINFAFQGFQGTHLIVLEKKQFRFYCRLLWSRTATVALSPCTWPQLSVVIGWAEEYLHSRCFSWKMIRLRGWMVYCSRIRFMEDLLGMPLLMIIWSRFVRIRRGFL